jgi:LuxR family maltose regulon positive regulatory protein
MVEALEAGAPAGFLWTYLREGPEILSALREAVLKNPSAGHRRLRSQLLSNNWSSSDSTDTALPQSLTAAELVVLRKMQMHRPYREVAAELHLSVNTIRTHAQSIRRKLGVSSRLEAVRRATELGLLD